jgi:hypothetical protein
MSKNPHGFTRSGPAQEWGRKSRKEEDRLRGLNHAGRREAIETGLDEIFAEILDGEDPYDGEAGIWDTRDQWSEDWS